LRRALLAYRVDRFKRSYLILFRAVAFHPLAFELAGTADRGGLFARALLARLLVVAAQLHIALDALTLQLILDRAQGLVNIVIANHDLHIFRHLKNRPEPAATAGMRLDS
jgi:hypothetical protein